MSYQHIESVKFIVLSFTDFTLGPIEINPYIQFQDALYEDRLSLYIPMNCKVVSGQSTI